MLLCVNMLSMIFFKNGHSLTRNGMTYHGGLAIQNWVLGYIGKEQGKARDTCPSINRNNIII